MVRDGSGVLNSYFFDSIASGKIRVGGLLSVQLGTSLIVHFK